MNSDISLLIELILQNFNVDTLYLIKTLIGSELNFSPEILIKLLYIFSKYDEDSNPLIENLIKRIEPSLFILKDEKLLYQAILGLFYSDKTNLPIFKTIIKKLNCIISNTAIDYENYIEVSLLLNVSQMNGILSKLEYLEMMNSLNAKVKMDKLSIYIDPIEKLLLKKNLLFQKLMKVKEFETVGIFYLLDYRAYVELILKGPSNSKLELRSKYIKKKGE